ncbi:MAG: Lrp/AsnC family transcriptional regulator [Spirochaetales bacterium]|nr:Lrp/AsnC family transcriptional regulator [Candidatus Physcosoma equi]
MIKKIDETNKQIIRLLKDGRKPYSMIADELGITENTVRSRVNKLLEEGVLRIAGMVDPQHVPGLQVIIMGVKLSTMELAKKAEEFLTLRGVVSVAVVTGRYDLIVKLVLSEEDDLTLLQFFSEELKKVKEVLDVETYVVYQSHELLVPYIL